MFNSNKITSFFYFQKLIKGAGMPFLSILELFENLIRIKCNLWYVNVLGNVKTSLALSLRKNLGLLLEVSFLRKFKNCFESFCFKNFLIEHGNN